LPLPIADAVTAVRAVAERLAAEVSR
jgi:hypothetical protein